MGPRSNFSKPRQGAAEKSANATRRCCFVRGSRPVGMSTGEIFVFAASFCTMRRFFCVQKPLADRAELRTLKSDANREGTSIYFLKIHRFYASFFAFCRVLRVSTSLLCPLLGNFFKNFRTIVGRYSLELLRLIEAGVQRNRDLIVFSDANLLDELLQNGAAFIVVGGVVNIRPCKQLVADKNSGQPFYSCPQGNVL